MRVKCNAGKCKHNISGYCYADEINIRFEFPNSTETDARVNCDYEEQ
jgi:hypothetical protein